MVALKKFIENILTRKFFNKVASYALLILMFYVFSDFLGIFLLTFVFGYLFLTLAEFFKVKIDHFVSVHLSSEKLKKYLRKIFCLNTIIIIEYIVFTGVIIFTVSDLLPKLIRELSDLPSVLPFLSEDMNLIVQKLEEISRLNSEIGGTLSTVISEQDYQLLYSVLGKLKTASLVVLQIFLSLLLSLIIILDRDKTKQYLSRIKTSNFGFLYKEYKIIFEKIVKSFGLIFKAQATIAGVNALLTVAGLMIIGAIHGGAFPYILTLGLIVFLFGFVPVFGVFLSSIPILFVAFSMIGGINIIVEIVLLITLVHMLEAYYLNPKIVSNFIEIPVSLTFLILIVSEHFFGVAGLLIGVSMFYFLMGLMRDFDKGLSKTKKKTNKAIKLAQEELDK